MKKIILVIFFASIAMLGVAQPGDPGGGGKPVPIGGIEILIAAGAALGVRSLVRSKKP